MANLVNMSVAAFKRAMNLERVDIARNPKTNLLFAAGDNGSRFRVQGDLDISKEILVLVEGGDLNNACFVNKSDKLQPALISL